MPFYAFCTYTTQCARVLCASVGTTGRIRECNMSADRSRLGLSAGISGITVHRTTTATDVKTLHFPTQVGKGASSNVCLASYRFGTER